LKLHADAPTHLTTITASGPGVIEVNAVRHTGHLLIAPDAPAERWAVAAFATLTAADFEALAARRPEVLLFGTGTRQKLLHPRLTAACTRAQIGVETMDTAAACRTYNILMAEGRRVLAAVLQED
jgi:uncharacterized protein